jgi:hypothetical protein
MEVKPKGGYRLLVDGELMRTGDYYRDPNRGWVEIPHHLAFGAWNPIGFHPVCRKEES